MEGGTSHISVVDGYGNAAAMTTSIEDAFGSRQMVGGFLLNNQLTDFSFAPASVAAPAAAGGTGGTCRRCTPCPRRWRAQPAAARQTAAQFDGADPGVRTGGERDGPRHRGSDAW